MANHHFYEQSTSSWHNEWANDGSDMEVMTEEEREEAEHAARVEMECALDEAVWHRKQERQDLQSSPFTAMAFDDEDAPF